MAKLYLHSEKDKHSHLNEDETTDEDETSKSKFPNVVDMFSILSDMDHIK